MANLPQWKRLPSLHYFDPKWGLEDDDLTLGSTKSPKRLNLELTAWPSVQKQIVVPEKNNEHIPTDLVTPYLLAASAASALLVFLILTVYLVKRKKQKGRKDEENGQSILVFPSSNGGHQPQFFSTNE